MLVLGRDEDRQAFVGWSKRVITTGAPSGDDFVRLAAPAHVSTTRHARKNATEAMPVRKRAVLMLLYRKCRGASHDARDR